MKGRLQGLAPGIGAGAVLASAVFGYCHDGGGTYEAALWALAGLGALHAGRFVLMTCASMLARPQAREGIAVPQELDAALRGLAHDLRSPIAAAAAAFAAFDDHLGPDVGDEDLAYLRSAVRRNLEKARERLKTLEERRLQVSAAELGPGLKNALARGASSKRL